MDGHSACVNVLCEASPVLISHCSPSDKLLVQTELSRISKQWADIEKTWKKREADLEEIKATAKQYHMSHDSLLESLSELEEKLAEQPPVGTELKIVKEQLQEHKVGVFVLTNDTPCQVVRAYLTSCYGMLMRTFMYCRPLTSD